MISDKVKELQTEEKKAEDQLSEIQARLRIARLEDIKAEFGVEEGKTIVRCRGKVYRISLIETEAGYWRDRPWARGWLRKKDGSFSEIVHHLYNDWQVGE